MLQLAQPGTYSAVTGSTPGLSTVNPMDLISGGEDFVRSSLSGNRVDASVPEKTDIDADLNRRDII